MKGDVILVEEHHKKAAQIILHKIISDIKAKTRRYVITIAGESGGGKSEMGKAIKDALNTYQIKGVVLGQDDYFILPPRTNDVRRRQDPLWLGPHAEIKMDVLEGNLIDAIQGEDTITKPLVDYDHNTISEEKIDLSDVKVLIAEGTYTSLLRNVDTRIFIDKTFEDTLTHRKKRKRGEEVGDPFIEQILVYEHQIIAGHKFLADIIITKDYDVILTTRVI
jgi:uridine kinase